MGWDIALQRHKGVLLKSGSDIVVLCCRYACVCFFRRGRDDSEADE